MTKKKLFRRIDNPREFNRGGYRIVQGYDSFKVYKQAANGNETGKVIAKSKGYSELVKRFRKKGDVFLNF